MAVGEDAVDQPRRLRMRKIRRVDQRKEHRFARDSSDRTSLCVRQLHLDRPSRKKRAASGHWNVRERSDQIE